MSTALPPLGFISIDVPIHRPPGDPYNEQTWPFALVREEAAGSSLSQVVTDTGYDDAFIERFVDAGLRLAKRGCVGIITSCGFLAMAQPQLSARLPIPIATSALVQIPSILCFLGPRQTVGILTYDDARLGPGHLLQLGIQPTRCHIRGAPSSGKLRTHIQEQAKYEHAEIEAELVRAAKNLLAEHKDIRALVLECTNMPPFAEAIHHAVGVPVYDVYTMGMWFYSGLCRRNSTYQSQEKT